HEVTDESAIVRRELGSERVDARERRAQTHEIAPAACGDRDERTGHGFARGDRAYPLVTYELVGEHAALLAVAADGRELGPGERDPRERVLRHERRDTPGIAGAIQRGVRRDQTRRDARGSELLHGPLPQRRRGEWIAARVQDVGGDLLHHRQLWEAREQR